MARLILQTAEGQQAIELRPVTSLGRHPNNTIQLLDKIVSKEHCIIEQRGDIFVLRDLGSLNGTFVNNERVRGEAPLKHGDEISLGATKGRFDDLGAVGLPAQPPPQQQAGPSAWPPPPGPPPAAAAIPSPMAQSAHVMPAPQQYAKPGIMPQPQASPVSAAPPTAATTRSRKNAANPRVSITAIAPYSATSAGSGASSAGSASRARASVR